MSVSDCIRSERLSVWMAYQSYDVSFAGPGYPSLGPSRDEKLVDMNSALIELLVRTLLNVWNTAAAGLQSSEKAAAPSFMVVQ